MGTRQRVMRRDVVLLCLSSLFGLGLGTILLLSVAAYARLSADIDGQLRELGDQIDQRFTREVGSAAAQLSAMRDALLEAPCLGDPRLSKPAVDQASATIDPCEALTTRWSGRNDLPVRTYLDFTAFALIDPGGWQRVKAARGANGTDRHVLVADRGYFRAALTHEGLWRSAACPSGCGLESHWSWTTGKPQVVLSTPTSNPSLPVAALAMPMEPLLKPVLPPGFEFAVVDEGGQVHFHSDIERNVHENLFIETDRTPRLQSLMGSHGAGLLNTAYWGRPYRAYVRPTAMPGWSIVTLHEKQPTRALVLSGSSLPWPRIPCRSSSGRFPSCWSRGSAAPGSGPIRFATCGTRR
ncbi:MAG: hypothetical protein R2712_13490 [Vicinamibacterales bacterium]